MTDMDALWAILRVAFGCVTGIFVIGGMVRGLQMGGGRRPDLVTGWNNEALPDVAAASRSMSRLYLAMAAVMLGLLALLFFGVRLVVWGGLFGLALWVWCYLLNAITEREIKRIRNR